MSSAACIVAVDVGNTAVKLAVRQDDVVRNHSIAIRKPDWERSAIAWVRDRLGCRHTSWQIASVHRRAASRLVDAVGQDNPDANLHLVGYRDVPMEVCVDHPDRLGIDRLLGAYAARQIWGCPLVVVDAGSAVTVDWVDDRGAFCGGAILPGLTLQARALATGTDALPQIQWEDSVSGDGESRIRLPARNTGDAIHAGILVGVSACIDELTDRYRREADQDAAGLVITGGDSHALGPHLRNPHHRIDNLVCHGLLNLLVS